MDWEQLLVAALIGGVISGGGLAALGYRGLKDKLIGDLKAIFAKRSDLNGLGDRVKSVEVIAMGAGDTAAQNRNTLERMEERDRGLNQRLADALTRIEQSIRDIDSRQREDRRLLDRHVVVLDQITERLGSTNHQHGRDT